MTKVQRPIDPSDFSAIPRTREMIKKLPDMIRICAEHGEEVTVQERDSSSNSGCFVPFAKADWVGCCDESIDRVTEGVKREIIGLIDRAKKTYTDELAMKLEPEHTGEMVAIELETGDYFVGEYEIDAADKARAAGHEGSLYFLRVGSPYAHRLMTPRS